MSTATAEKEMQPIETKLINRVDVGKAYQLYKKGLQQSEIAKLQGVSVQAINQALKRFIAIMPNPEEVKVYAEHEAEILQSSKLIHLNNLIDPSKVKKSSSRDSAVTFGILDDKRTRLMGNATVIISYPETKAEIEELQKEIAEYEQEELLILQKQADGSYQAPQDAEKKTKKRGVNR